MEIIQKELETMVYFIVANRAFNTRAEAEKFCNECDFNLDLIQEVEEV